MVAPGQLYAAVVGLLLLVALGVSVPVLKQIVLDGLERQRKRRAGELERYTEDEEYHRSPGPPDDAAERESGTCRQCGAENDPDFMYCRRCAAPL